MVLMKSLRNTALLFAALLCCSFSALAQPETAKPGFYSTPAIHGDTVVFTSEGDLWTVSTQGGLARRLTSNPGREEMPAISADGKTVAFVAQYEGPAEVYTIAIDGGMPQRRTWDGDAQPEGWTPDGRLMVRTKRFSTLPEPELVLIDAKDNREVVPLYGAAEGAYDGRTLFFTRWDRQSSSTKRYKGGWAENLWRFDGSGEAVPLTGDWEGTSHNPMFWNGRVYFLSDRDGVMNVYSMDRNGKGLKEESHQKTFDVQAASVSDGRVVYSSGADLWLLDLKTGHESVIPIQLSSDFDQLREHWVKKPLEYLTSVHIAPDGGGAVFTARGEVFTAPAKPGRIVKVAGESEIRYREARYMPDGKTIEALSTASGETEFWSYPANGVVALDGKGDHKPEQWTHDSTVERYDGAPSPDGHWLAHYDRNDELWVLDLKSRQDKRIAQSTHGGFDELRWSPDSRWLAFVEGAANQFRQIKLLNVESGAIETITDDRYNSMSPAWSGDGKWLYFLSDRMLKTTVGSPWGPREPEPHFDRSVKIYELALTPGLRSPFLPPDELHPDSTEKKDDKAKDDGKSGDKAKDAAKPDDKDSKDSKDDKKPAEKKVPEVKIDFAGLTARLTEVPAKPGNYGDLQATEKRLCWLSAGEDEERGRALQCLEVANKGDEPETVVSGVAGYEVSLDRKKMLVRQKDDFFILDGEAKADALKDPKAAAKAKIDLSHWVITTTPREEFRGIFDDAWRMERDYFYDRHMHGVDWKAMHDRYRPLVDRVADRDELNDVLAQMFGELSTLHTFVRGGDDRKPADEIDLASLGALLRRDERAGGFVVEHIYEHDPDLPDAAPPIARPESLVTEGETIVSIDGQSVLSAPDARELLRGKSGTQVLLEVKSTKGELRSVLVKPIRAQQEADLRYNEWEYTRRTKVDKDSDGKIGYVHLRAMGSNDMDQWARDYYPVFDRQGLIIDMRHNHGGNIDPWLLSKLLRQAWMYWQPRVGDPSWNMQAAFRGHMIVLCDHETASDGEAFSEGFKRLKLGKVLGTRTWGGEVWLSSDNVQADHGLASAAETGVYGPEGKWLIEGHGVDPDIVVDNLPHATFTGEDAQLEAAMKELKAEIQADPRPVPKTPQYPDKSFKGMQ